MESVAICDKNDHQAHKEYYKMYIEYTPTVSSERAITAYRGM